MRRVLFEIYTIIKHSAEGGALNVPFEERVTVIDAEEWVRALEQFRAEAEVTKIGVVPRD